MTARETRSQRRHDIFDCCHRRQVGDDFEQCLHVADSVDKVLVSMGTSSPALLTELRRDRRPAFASAVPCSVLVFYGNCPIPRVRADGLSGRTLFS